MRKEENYHFSELVQEWIRKYTKQNKNITIIVNKKWYASGVICRDCGHIPQCKNCSVSISYHNDQQGHPFGLCHICKTHYDIPPKCPKCQSNSIRPYGLWIQQVADRIQQTYNIIPDIIDTQTVNSPNKIKKHKQQKHSNITIGTSLLTTPIKNYKTDIVIFLNADLGLNIPDYTAASKNFFFLYETIQQYKDAHFIVQSFDPEHYSIRSACKMNKEAFQREDEVYRKQYNYPPYSDLCVLLYKHETEERVYANVDKLHKELLYYKEKYTLDDMEIYTTPPLIYKKFGKYRYNIIIKGKQIKNFMDIIYTKCKLHNRWFKVDRQADSVI